MDAPFLFLVFAIVQAPPHMRVLPDKIFLTIAPWMLLP